MKRLVALSLVLLLSIESFAAVVGDNDGAAFITKAEFDSLKSTFQSQIDRYNASIDNKIDGAIASYLSGILLNTNVSFYSNNTSLSFPIRIIDHIKKVQEVTDPSTDGAATELVGKKPLWSPAYDYQWSADNYDWSWQARIARSGEEQLDKISYGIQNGDDFKVFGEGNMPTVRFIRYQYFDKDKGNNNYAFVIRFDGKTETMASNSKTAQNWQTNSSTYARLANYDVLRTSRDSFLPYLPEYYLNKAVVGNTWWNIDSGIDNIFFGTNESTIKQWGTGGIAGYSDAFDTYEASTVGYTKDSFTRIYNNSSNSNLCPIGYDDGGKPFIYYTNKKQNRLCIAGDKMATWEKAVQPTSYIKRCWQNKTLNTGMGSGICFVITAGENLESENEHTSRPWYNKSLIRQSHLVYDVIWTDGNKLENHRMTNGIPIFNFKSEKMKRDIDECVVNLSIESQDISNPKYVIFSQKPITENNYDANVDTNNDYISISSINGSNLQSGTKKAELIEGDNKITLDPRSINTSGLLYIKILWETSTSESGENYDDEYVTLGRPSIDFRFNG